MSWSKDCQCIVVSTAMGCFESDQNPQSRRRVSGSVFVLCLILIGVSITPLTPPSSKTRHAFQFSKNATRLPKPESIKQRQIENFRKGNGLIMDIHLTHHAGTYFCGVLKSVLTAPDFACMGIRDAAEFNLTDAQIDDFKQHLQSKPWNYTETQDYIPRLKAMGFDVKFQEFGSPLTKHQRHTTRKRLTDTDWEHPQLVSVFIARDPLERLLSPGGAINKIFGSTANRTYDKWWMYANQSASAPHGHKVNNFNLHFLTDSFDCCQGAQTDRKHLYAAQQLASRFTFILDQACLEDNLRAFGRILGIDFELKPNPINHHRQSVQERIPYRDVYEFLVKKNQLDIEFYEWTKTKSLVQCDPR